MPGYSDKFLRQILTTTRVIAAVGVSENPIRPSYFAARYLSKNGYRMIGVNPALAGRTYFGQPAYAALTDIPTDAGVDMVEIFRRATEVPAIVETALAHFPGLRTIWMQVGVENAEAAAMAEAAGKVVIQDRCPKIEHQRLYGALRKAGFNTGIISSRL